MKIIQVNRGGKHTHFFGWYSETPYVPQKRFSKFKIPSHSKTKLLVDENIIFRFAGEIGIPDQGFNL